MKKAVLFDLFGTLVPSPPFSEYRQMVDAVAETLEIDPEEFFDPWMAVNDGRLDGRFGSSEAEVKHVADQLGVTPTDEQMAICTEVRRSAVHGWITPKPSAIDVLQRLKDSGHSLALVSDCVFDVPAVWERTDLAAVLEQTVFSCQMGVRKPDRRMYEHALNSLGASASESLFVGDGGSNELQGASEVGIDAVLLDDHDPETEVLRVDVKEWSGPSIRSLEEVIPLAAGR